MKMNVNIKKISLGFCFGVSLLGTYYLGTQNYFENVVFLQKIQNIITNLTQESKGCNCHKAVPVVKESSNEVIEITDQDTLRNLIKEHKGAAVIFFNMNGCGFCTKMKPVYHEIVKNPRFDKIKFYSANGRDLQAPTIVQDLLDQKINGYPFFLFMDENGYVDKHAGYKPQPDFEAKIADVFGDLVPAAAPNAKVVIQAVNNAPKTSNNEKKGEISKSPNNSHEKGNEKSHETTPKIKELIQKFVEETGRIPGDCKSSGKDHKEKGHEKEPKEKSSGHDKKEEVKTQAVETESSAKKGDEKKKEPKEKSNGHEKKQKETKKEEAKKEKREKIEHAYQAYKKLYDAAKEMDNKLIISKEDNEKVKKSAIKLFDCRNIKNMVWRAWKTKARDKPQVKQPGSHEKSEKQEKSNEKNK